jgi:CPA2 family monovalent cation:H+ antiporter-2
MPHEVDLILTLTGGLTAALIFGFLTQRLRLSPIVGYLLAGVVVGPFTPGFVAHGALAQQLAEIGIILLMFGVGLNFHVNELLAVRRVAIPGALGGIAVATGLGVLVARSWGWSLGAGVLFGLTISVASTVVLSRVLSDRDVLHTQAGHVAIGWLVVEDLFTVLVLVMMPLLVGERAGGSVSVVLASVGLAIVKIAGLVVFTLVIGKRALPIVLGYVARSRSRDLFTLAVLVLALGIAVISAKLFGASMALGAFLAGMVVGQSEFASRAASEALPMRDAFAVLFFVSVGMLFDPHQLLPNAALTGVTIAVILVGKPLAAFAIARGLKYSPRTSVTVAVALGQIGEFSFIVVALGRELGVLPSSATQVLVAASIVTITLNPLILRAAEPLIRRLSSPSKGEPEVPEPTLDPAHRAIVVGYGPVGRTVTRLLRENGITPTVIELNHEVVTAIGAEGQRAIYGDASQREILERAGVRASGSLVFAASGSPAEAVIRMAKELNPDLLILARSAYVREVEAVRRAGAHVVVAAEAEVALAMTEHLLTQLGATSEQLDRARERVRGELAG